jgi:hypothetical protein
MHSVEQFSVPVFWVVFGCGGRWVWWRTSTVAIRGTSANNINVMSVPTDSARQGARVFNTVIRRDDVNPKAPQSALSLYSMLLTVTSLAPWTG